MAFFPINRWIFNICLLITLERIKLETWGWSHLKGLFKGFPNHTSIVGICQEINELSSIKASGDHDSVVLTDFTLFCP